jgi:hypothetical protein
MSKQFMYFASILFMMAAILAVSAQEDTAALSNDTMNNTTLLNNTTLNASLNETLDVTTSEPVSVASDEIVIEAPILPAETTPAQIEEIAAQNETAPAQNVTIPEDVAIPEEAVSTASPMPVASQPGVMQLGSAGRTVFAIGGENPNLFSIDGKTLHEEAHEVGLPAKTVMDLGNLPFFINKI